MHIIDSAFDNEQKIELIKKDITDSQIKYLVTKQTNKIIILDIHQNKLTSLSMLIMKEAKWDTLQYLLLGCNMIGDKGCKYFLQAKIPEIIKLGLKQNHISSIGFSHLIKAQWPKIKWINFDENLIGVDVSKYLSKAKWNKTIGKIYFWCNNFVVGQAYKLSLCDMPQINSIFLWYNMIDSWQKYKLKSMLDNKFQSAQFILV